MARRLGQQANFIRSEGGLPLPVAAQGQRFIRTGVEGSSAVSPRATDSVLGNAGGGSGL